MDPDAALMTDASVHRNRRQKQRWSDLSAGQQVAIVLGAGVEFVLTAFALRDLARRPAKEVRGGKSLWALAFLVQPIGPVIYVLVGRRREAR